MLGPSAPKDQITYMSADDGMLMVDSAGDVEFGRKRGSAFQHRIKVLQRIFRRKYVRRALLACMRSRGVGVAGSRDVRRRSAGRERERCWSARYERRRLASREL